MSLDQRHTHDLDRAQTAEARYHADVQAGEWQERDEAYRDLVIGMNNYNEYPDTLPHRA